MVTFSDRRYVFYTALVALLGFGALMRGIDTPFIGHHEAFNGAWWSLIARNYLRYGFIKLKFGQVIDGFMLAPKPFTYYANHPPLLPIAVAVFFKLFGEHEWAARLIPVLSSTASVFLVFLIGREIWGSRAGFIASAFFVVNPLFLFYGRMVNHEPLVTFFALLAVFSYVKWLKGEMRYLWVLCGAIVLGGFTDWPMFYLLPILGAHYLVFAERKSFLALFPLGIAGAVLCIIYLQIRWLGPATYQEIINFFFIRTNLIADRNKETAITLLKLLRTVAPRANRFFTLPIIATSALGLVASSFPRYKEERAFGFSLLVGLLAFGTIHVVLFKEGAVIHDYWIYYFLPVLALSTGILFDAAGSLIPKPVALTPAAVILVIVALASRTVVRDLHMEDNRELPMFGQTATELTSPQGSVLTSISVGAFGMPLIVYYTKRPVVELVTDVPKFQQALATTPSAELMIIYKGQAPELQRYLDTRYRRFDRGNLICYPLNRKSDQRSGRK